MPIFQLIYVSSLVTTELSLVSSILEVAIRNNRQRHITGMMLYADGNVMQVLEGKEEVVRNTFRAIESDMRHSGIFVLLEQKVSERQFGPFSMGFRQLTNADLAVLPQAANAFRAFPGEISMRGSSGDALLILETFCESASLTQTSTSMNCLETAGYRSGGIGFAKYAQ